MPDKWTGDVHEWSTESRTVKVGARAQRREATQVRLVCSCGYATHWSQCRDRVARLMAEGHAHDGQLSVW